MNPSIIVVCIALLLLVLQWGRRIPLTGGRKRAVIACRIAAILALCTSFLNFSVRHLEEIPRRLIYLVDHSASIDAQQSEWIARRLASIESLRPSRMERAVIAFSDEPQLVLPLSNEPAVDPQAIRQAIDSALPSRERTNLEAALLAAAALVAPDEAAPGRGASTETGVVLFSDGRQTSGHVNDVLASLRQLGIHVFPVNPPTFGEVKTVWERLVVPPVVQQGSPVAVQLVLFNGSERSKWGEVSIGLRGVTVKRQRSVIRPGWHVVTLDVPALGRGTMALDVQLALPEEQLQERRSAFTEVEGPPQVLLVGDRLAKLPALATALKHRGMEVAVAKPSELPLHADRLLDYDAVLLWNVPKSQLSPEQADAVKSYVEQFGGGLVTVGLGGELAAEVNSPSPLDPLLPVRFEPKGLREATRRVCTILLIDRSASMMGPRMAATKRAAVELVKQLAPEDLVGILAFDTQAWVVSEVQPAGQLKSTLVEKLVKLRSSGGTDIYPALTAATDRLDLTGATVKHILLLSDGNTPFHEQAYKALIKSLKLQGTTVSTIGIGAAFINTDYLQWLAGSTGGTFYQLREIDELPQLVARDTQKALGRLPFTEGYFRPTRTPITDWFLETPEWPVLRGYLTATAKPGARVDLTIDGGNGPDPLLARWTVGRGRVVSFMSDADVRWSPEWIRWPGFEGAWAQIARWAMRPRLTEELFTWIDESQGAPQLVVEGRLHDPRGSLIASGDAGAANPPSIPLSFVQTGQWRWHASLEQIQGGWYQLLLESRIPMLLAADSADAPPQQLPGAQRGSEAAAAPSPPPTSISMDADVPVFAKRWIQVGAPATSLETAGQPADESLLRHIARAGAGAYDMPDRALLPPTTTTTVTKPLASWWLPLAILFLLLEIALRGASML